MGRYLPGYKDGGPVRSIKNLTDRLGNEYDFRILTCDRDHGDDTPYAGISYDEWNAVGNAKVWYVKPAEFTPEVVLKCSDETDLVYVCGCFNDYARSAMKVKHKGVLKAPLVIAAMGLFSPGAFHIRYPKKKAYMIILGLLGYFRQVEWSATSEEEAKDIRRQVGKNAICHLAEDLPRLPERIVRKGSSKSGELRIIFLSRISEKKNLSYAVDMIRKFAENNPKAKLAFHIWGNIEDPDYWQKCQRKLTELPENVSWEYCGIADAEQVAKVFSEYDVFLFPTLGENYGHVIFEALSGGCIPIISDQTPWTGEKMEGNGNRFSLEDEEGFIGAIDKYCMMDEAELTRRAETAMAFALNYRAVDAEEGYRKIFDRR